MMRCLRFRPQLKQLNRTTRNLLAAAVGVALMFAARAPVFGDTAKKGRQLLKLKPKG